MAWMAPESLTTAKWSTKSDVWCVCGACVCACVCVCLCVCVCFKMLCMHRRVALCAFARLHQPPPSSSSSSRSFLSPNCLLFRNRSCGVCFWEIVTFAKRPFAAVPMQEITKAHAHIQIHLPPPPSCPPELCVVLQALLLSFSSCVFDFVGSCNTRTPRAPRGVSVDRLTYIRTRTTRRGYPVRIHTHFGHAFLH